MTGNSSRRALVPLDKYCLTPYLASRVREEPSISTRSRMCSSLVVECRDWAGSAVRLAFGNGANDVGKSVTALMMDPDTAAFKPRYSPLIWGGLFSGLGSILAIIISVKLFSA